MQVRLPLHDTTSAMREDNAWGSALDEPGVMGWRNLPHFSIGPFFLLLVVTVTVQLVELFDSSSSIWLNGVRQITACHHVRKLRRFYAFLWITHRSVIDFKESKCHIRVLLGREWTDVVKDRRCRLWAEHGLQVSNKKRRTHIPAHSSNLRYIALPLLNAPTKEEQSGCALRWRSNRAVRDFNVHIAPHIAPF